MNLTSGYSLFIAMIENKMIENNINQVSDRSSASSGPDEDCSSDDYPTVADLHAISETSPSGSRS